MRELFLAWPRFRAQQQAPRVRLKRARERKQTKPYIVVNHTQAAFFFLLYLWKECNMHFFTLGNGVSIDIKAKRYRAPRVVQGRYAADEP